MIILFSFLLIVGLTHESMVNELNDYKNHPCIRNCNTSTPMECNYFFTVEWYKTLSKACYDCPQNRSDCDRPHCITADGVERVVMSVNRMIPGPQIQVCQNDIVNVMVHNQLRMGEATSIHWHGILQKDYQYMDGVGMITQCPINPHTSFQYRFKVEDAGTHFWHAHVGLQRSDGVFGAFIVKPKYDVHSSEYDYDLNEHVIVMNDWFHDTIISHFAFHHHGETHFDKAEGILINGKGVSYNKRDNTTTITPRAVFKVKQGYKFRFRLINSGVAFCPIQFIVDNHTLTAIATDGKPVEPKTFDAVVLHPGERLDVVINANQKKDNYWIKAKGLGDCDINEVFQTAILNYEGVSSEDTHSSEEIDYDSIVVTGPQLNNIDVPENANADVTKNYVQINELKSIPESFNESYYYDKIKGTPDKKFYFGMEFKKINNPEFNDPLLYPIKMVALHKQFYTPQINKISLNMPSSPLLTQFNDTPKEMICNEANMEKVCPKDSTEFCSCLHLIEVSLNDLVEFIFVDENKETFDVDIETIHPIHLHGYKYAVVGMGEPDHTEPTTADYIKRLDNQGKLERNFDRPPIKDTVIVPDSGYTIMRFIANNPGIWIVHCHLELHMEVGMAFLLKVGDITEFSQEPPNWPKCGSFSISSEVINSSNVINQKFGLLFIFSLIFSMFFKLNL